MPDFNADFPFPEVIIKIAIPEKICAVGDCVAGMKAGNGRVEAFVDGGIRVHPLNAQEFCAGDVLCSPGGSVIINEVLPV